MEADQVGGGLGRAAAGSFGLGLTVLIALVFGAASCVAPAPPPTTTTTSTSTTTVPRRPVPYDFDGNGAADLVFADTMTMEWFRVGQPAVIGQTSGPPAHGDFDGDGVWELASVNGRVWGQWVTLGARGTFMFAGPTDPSVQLLAVPGRYDRDGRTKAAFYGTTDGVWYIEGHDPVAFGVPYSGGEYHDEDVPVPGDYDGDGSDELAVYRPRTSTFFTFGDPTGVQVGSVGDVPVAADYDGDGAVDPATYTPSTGVWHIAGKPDIAFGGTTGTPFPAPADYDGDGRAEPAVFLRDTGGLSISSASSVVTLGPSYSTGSYMPATLNFNDTLVMIKLAFLKECVDKGNC